MNAVIPTVSRPVDHIAPLTLATTAWVASLGTPATREAYGRDLTDFTRFCAASEVDSLAATRTLVDLFARQLEADGKAPATIARRLAALGSFYSFLVDEGVLATSPVDRVRRPRVSEESPRLGLDRFEAVALLRVAEAHGPRDHALIALLLLNGLRVSEAISLAVDHIEHERGHVVVRFVGKGGTRRTAPLAPRTIAAVAEQIADRTQGHLFDRPDGRHIDRHQATRIVRRIARRAGIQKRISPHSLRHTMVTVALDAGVELHRVQDAAGHASPATTRRYDRGRNRLDQHATYRIADYLADA